jgi:hypothetical protein
MFESRPIKYNLNNNNNNNDDREVLANRPDIIIKNKKDKNFLTDRCSNTIGYECNTEGVRKEIKIQKSKYRNSANVEHEMFCHDGNH